MEKKIALSIVASLLLSHNIYAKDTPRKLDSIIVTANKIEENLQEVPISMTVFNEFAIEDRKIESVQDIASYTPNFTFFDKSGGYSMPTIRGISNSLPLGGFTQPVALIIDGIPISHSVGYNETLIDIERIEVLKGPQGTLYGKDAEAGVINIVTKQPNNETRGKLGVELGEDNKRQYSFSASGPIVKDKFYVGVSAKHYEKDGSIKNTLLGGYTNDKEHDYGKINLRYTPSDKLEISLISSKLQYDNGNIDYLRPYIPDDISMSTNEQGKDKSSTTAHALKISYDMDEYLFESITTYREAKLDSLQDFPSFNYYYQEKKDKYSQEFRVSNSSDIFKWVAGVYGDKSEVYNTSHVVGQSPIPSTAKLNSLGVFIHTDYAINDKFSIISGLRYDKDNIEYEKTTKKLDFSDSEISPKLSLKYQYDKNSMYYATISKGYRAGAYNTLDGYPAEYNSETLWNYEIGVKNRFFDNRVILNGSIFYMSIDDMQVRVYPIANSNLSYVDNVAKATSKGFEIGLSVKATDSLELFASYGYTNSVFDEYRDSKDDYSGNKNTYAPDYNYNIGFQYRGDQGYFARADLNGFGKTYFNNANTKSRDPYRLVNVKLGYEAGSYDIYFYGKNIFDKEHHSIGMFGGNGAILAPQRELGVQLAYRF